MQDIQYTAYLSNNNPVQTPKVVNFEDIPILGSKKPVTVNPLPISKPQEEVVVAQLPTESVIKGITDNSKKYNIGNMQHVIDAFEKAGISIRVTSGLRPGAMTKQGNKSHHSVGNALDITPNFAQGETWDSMRNKIRASKELQNYLIKNNIGILDETTPQMLAQTGGTGAHWHIGPDKKAVEGLRALISRNGSKLLQLGGQIQYSPYLYANFNDRSNDRAIVKQERIPKSYQKQYDLSDKPKTKYDQYMWPQKQEGPVQVDRTISDLAKFTGGFETFNPDAYVLNTSDGKPQTLAGYGSANPKIIELAKQGKLTEEIARKEMERHLQSEYDEWMKKVPNFKNLSRGVQLALVDTSYNGKGVSGTINGSPKLMKMINSGITDPKELVKEMDHSKDAGGWLGVRSAARRAMALDEYDWDWKTLDRFGRQVDYNKYKGPQDWKSSPYYNNY